MIKNKFIGIILILFFSSNSFAQNILWLTNGKQLKIGDYKLDNKEFVIYKNNKGKSKAIERFDVFAILENNSNEVIVYQPDSTSVESFNLLEMRAFVQGQSDAYKNFKSPLTTIGGIAIAGTSSVFINPMYVIVISGAYCGTIGLTKTSEKKIIIPQEYTNSDHYLLGYKRVTKHKRIKNAIIGTAIGLAAGLTTFAIVNN